MEDNKEMGQDKKNGSNNESKEMVDEKPFHYKHARANIAVDVVVFGVLPEDYSDSNELRVFVRKKHGKWWLPSKFMHCGTSIENETADDGENWTLEKTMRVALNRVWKVTGQESVCEETEGNKDQINDKIEREIVFTETTENRRSYVIKPNIDLICQLDAMSALGRDNRNKRVVSIPYMTLINIKEDIPSSINSNVAQWMPVSKLINLKTYKPGEEKLAHDHFDILKNGLKRLFQEIRTRPIGGSMKTVDGDTKSKYISKEDEDDIEDYFMLSSEFDLSHLINIYNIVLQAMGVSVERSNLRKLLLERGVIKEVDNESSSKKGWAPYEFVVDKYKEYKENLSFGFNPKPRDKK